MRIRVSGSTGPYGPTRRDNSVRRYLLDVTIQQEQRGSVAGCPTFGLHDSALRGLDVCFLAILVLPCFLTSWRQNGPPFKRAAAVCLASSDHC